MRAKVDGSAQGLCSTVIIRPSWDDQIWNAWRRPM